MPSDVAYYTKLKQFYTLFNAWTEVKAKARFGGVDRISIEQYSANEKENVEKLVAMMQQQTYSPEPYLKVSIPKNEHEKRELGMLTIQDKIVQTAIKNLIEPEFEKLFLNISYGYRPNKGAVKAINRLQHDIKQLKSKFILSIDIDHFFDNLNHELLFSKLGAVIKEPDILQLIRLCISMGKVDKNMHWNDIKTGVPQGAVLSPLLANLYLHEFDVWALSHKSGYIRYADDFIFMTNSEAQAKHIAQQARNVLQHQFLLKPNDKIALTSLDDGFEYLGIFVKKDTIGLSERKKERFKFKIEESAKLAHLNNYRKLNETAQGIQAFYGKLLPETELHFADEILLAQIKTLVQNTKYKYNDKEILNKLQALHFITPAFFQNKKDKILDFLTQTQIIRLPKPESDIEKKIKSKKREYQKLEAQGMELLITSPGTFIGVHQKQLKIKHEHKFVEKSQLANLKHITIISRGITITSDAIDFCIKNHVGIDFFNEKGIHLSAIHSLQQSDAKLWQAQFDCFNTYKAHAIANTIVQSKINNQLNLVKYFNKYHKNKIAGFEQHTLVMINAFQQLEIELQNLNTAMDIKLYRQQLLSIEGRAAALYWDAVKMLVAEKITFEKRETKGAKDTMNCLLNYGYAILYARIWIALLNSGLNPYISFLHTPAAGKPTLVFDFIEQFRSQVVDRVIVAMVQRDEPIILKDGLLDLKTRIALAENIFERWNRIELFRGEHIRFHDIVYKCAFKLADFIEGKEKKYKPYIAKW